MKNLPSIAMLLLANFISGIAQGISMIAIPIYFATENASARYGVIYAFATVFSILWVPIAGTLIDKYNRKNIFLVLMVICGVVLACVALWGYTSGGVNWQGAALVFVVTFLNYSLYYPALYAFLQEITEPKDYGRIASMIEVQGQFGSALSGAAAALLLRGVQAGEVVRLFEGLQFSIPFSLPKWSLLEVFTFDAATYLMGFLLIWSIRRYQAIAERHRETGTVIERLRTAWEFLRLHPYTLLFGVSSYVVFVTLMVFTFVLAPVYVKNILHAPQTVYAISEIFYAIGAILAGLATRRLFRRWTTVRAVIALTLTTAALLMAMVLSDATPLFYVMLLLYGITNAGTRILRVNYIFNYIPNQFAGRANSFFNVVNTLMRSIVLLAFAFPFFYRDANILFPIAFLAVLTLASAIVMLVYRDKVENAAKPD